MQASDDSEKEVLWLDITMLMSQLSADIMRLDGGSKSTVIGMAQEIPAASLQKALTQIFNHWQRGPSRSNDRKSIHASLDLAAGINDGYCQLNKGCPIRCHHSIKAMLTSHSPSQILQRFTQSKKKAVSR